MKLKTLMIGTLAALALGGCAHSDYKHDKPYKHHKHHCCHRRQGQMACHMHNTGVMYAVAVMRPTKGSRVHGEIWFTEKFGKVKIQGTLFGLPPNSKHGFHVHEYGDCLAPDGSSAGPHFNPEHEPHGNPNGVHEAGDLFNIVANRYGQAHINMEISGISLNGPLNPIIGRSLIVHKDADDYTTQPSGNSGPRISCGVIGAAASLPQWLEKQRQKK